MTEANPFDELHPVIRNEEDEIRKGIFSFALRTLQGLSLEEKQSWCQAIKESTAPKQPKSKVAVKGAAPPSEVPAAVVVPSETDESTGQSGTRDAGAKRERSCPLVGNAVQEPPAKVEKTEDPPVAVGETASPLPEPAMTAEAASECIGAYLRVLLDKVVGGSLSDLAVPALRVLCRMVGITTTARSKDALYSMLANFHFTHCARLGKRVSKQTFVEQEARQTAAMMRKIAPTGSKASPSSSSSSSAAAKRTAAPEPKQQKKKQQTAVSAAVAKAEEKPPARAETTVSRKEERKVLKRTVSAATVAAVPSNSGHTNNAVKSSYSDEGFRYSNSEGNYDDSSDNEELDVTFHQRTFRQPPPPPLSASTPFTSSHLSSSSDVGGSVPGMAWTTQDLDRKIASIVQLYDPVTVAIVVKKLSQMGYRDAAAADVVENSLRRFHRMQLIFYDNGIAYML